MESRPFNKKEFAEEANTLKRDVKASAADRITLELGDSKHASFMPQAKITRWDNEVNFSIRRDNGARTFVERNGKVVAESAKEDVVFYELEADEINEDGGLEVEVHLKEKPDTNVFEFTLQTKELDFFYQPALTPEEIAEGASQPENVEGSYAVYHKTQRDNRVGGKEYKTGKAFHIYRPHVKDAGGNETWAELSINEGGELLTVTVPQVFLDSAVYPVIVDPTFGYTSKGATIYSNTYANEYHAVPITSPSDASALTAISSWVARLSGTNQAKYAIYQGNSLLVQGSAFVSTNTDTVSTQPVASALSPSTAYSVGILHDNPLFWWYDSVASNGIYKYPVTFATPGSISGYSTNSRRISIYATYTAAPSGPSPLTASQGSFTLTGQVAGFSRSYRLQDGQASFVLTKARTSKA